VLIGRSKLDVDTPALLVDLPAMITVFLHEEMYGIRDDRVEIVWPILARGRFR
jgi:hypothetical protein